MRPVANGTRPSRNQRFWGPTNASAVRPMPTTMRTPRSTFPMFLFILYSPGAKGVLKTIAQPASNRSMNASNSSVRISRELIHAAFYFAG